MFDTTLHLNHGAFQQLKDVTCLNRVGVVLGALTWPHGQDIAPETVLAELAPVLARAGFEVKR